MAKCAVCEKGACHCGKIGCIETEVSGRALQRKLTEKIRGWGRNLKTMLMSTN